MSRSAQSTIDSLAGLISSQKAAAATFEAALADLRGRIAEGRNAIHDAEEALPDQVEVKSRIDSLVAHLAAQAVDKLNIDTLILPTSQFDAERYAERVSQVSGVTTGLPVLAHFALNNDDATLGFGEVEAGLPQSPQGLRIQGLSATHMAAFLTPDALGARLLAEASASLSRDGSKPLSAKQRDAETRRLRHELVELERTEERLIRVAEASGLAVARRPDADARWLLALDADLEVEAAA